MSTPTYSDLTTPGPKGLMLSLEGFPYAFGGPGVASVTWTGVRDDDWCDANGGEWTVLPGYLIVGDFATTDGRGRADLRWSERLRPVQGELEVGALTFRVHDAKPASGVAAGANALTYLISRTSLLTSTQLAATLASTTGAGGTFTVDDGSVFGSTDFYVYVGRETIFCSSRSGNTLTIASGGSNGGRGAYGSRPRTHTVVASESYAPAAYPSFPFAARRRVVLWMGNLTGAGVVTNPVPLWRGYLSQAPRLAADGATWELACEHLWTREVPCGVPTQTCRTVGYDVVNTAGVLAPLTAVVTTTVSGTDYTLLGFPGATTGTFFESLTALCNNALQNLRASANAQGVTGDFNVTPAVGGVRLTASIPAATRVEVSLHHFYVEAHARGTTRADTLVAMPPAVARLRQGLDTTSNYVTTFHVDSTAHLPATWGINAGVAGGRSFSTGASFYASAGDAKLLLRPTPADANANAVVDASAKTIRGYLLGYTPAAGAATAEDQGTGPILTIGRPGANTYGYSDWLDGQVDWGLVLTLDCSDWTYGLRYGLIGDTVLVGTPGELDVDQRDWNWDREARVYAGTNHSPRRRLWLLNGEQTLRDLVTEACQFSGAVLSLRRSRLAPDLIQPPGLSDVYAASHTLTTPGLVGRSRWQQNPDGLANFYDITIAGSNGTTYRWPVVDRRSAARYGQTKAVEIKPRGITLGPDAFAAGPLGPIQELLSRTLALWSEPVETLRVTVPIHYVDTIYLGDAVQVTEWLAPNNGGGRGWSARPGIVWGREPDLTAGTMALDVLAWPQYGRLAGFAPAVRAESISAATLTAAASYTYDWESSTATDYAGSNLTGYADTVRGTVANDRGVGFFSTTAIGAGAKVTLVERDNTNPRTPEALIIASVNTAAHTITFTTSPNAAWQTIITGGGKVDLIFNDYGTSGETTGQKLFAFVGDRATRVVGGTSDAVFTWAP